MRVGRVLTLAAICLLASACYRQVVQTGLTPGSTVVHNPWTPFFLWGLVSPVTVDVTSQCRSGIATVETQQTFVNGLVSALLFGLYSPRDVKVTCATGSALKPGMREFQVARGASQAEQEAVFSAAIEASERTNQPVMIRF
jgi:hypothetical protein